MAPKRQKNGFERFLENLKIGYINGQNPIARAHTSWGFLPAKNSSTNFGALMTGSHVDEKMLVRKDDPLQRLRIITSGIGRTERIHNTYLKPRVKLAD
jgi:hypothetical protein